MRITFTKKARYEKHMAIANSQRKSASERYNAKLKAMAIKLKILNAERNSLVKRGSSEEVNVKQEEIWAVSKYLKEHN